MLKHAEIHTARRSHIGHLLSFRGREPGRADDALVVVHQSVEIDRHLAPHGTDIHEGAAAAQTGVGGKHRRLRRAGPERVDHDIDALPAGKRLHPIRERTLCVQRSNMNPFRRDRFDLFQQLNVTSGSHDRRAPHREGKKGAANPKRSANAVDQHACRHIRAGTFESAIGRSQISPTSRRFEADIIRERNDAVLRRGHVFAEAPIGIVLEHLLRFRTETKIPIKGVIAACGRIAAATGTAAAAIARRVYVNAIADLDAVHLGAGLGNDAGGIQPEYRGQLRQFQMRKPFADIVQHVAEIRHDAAGFHFDKNVGWAWVRLRQEIDRQRFADFMHPGDPHRRFRSFALIAP